MATKTLHLLREDSKDVTNSTTIICFGKIIFSPLVLDLFYKEAETSNLNVYNTIKEFDIEHSVDLLKKLRSMYNSRSNTPSTFDKISLSRHKLEFKYLVIEESARGKDLLF